MEQYVDLDSPDVATAAVRVLAVVILAWAVLPTARFARKYSPRPGWWFLAAAAVLAVAVAVYLFLVADDETFSWAIAGLAAGVGKTSAAGLFLRDVWPVLVFAASIPRVFELQYKLWNAARSVLWVVVAFAMCVPVSILTALAIHLPLVSWIYAALDRVAIGVASEYISAADTLTLCVLLFVAVSVSAAAVRAFLFFSEYIRIVLVWGALPVWVTWMIDSWIRSHGEAVRPLFIISYSSGFLLMVTFVTNNVFILLNRRPPNALDCEMRVFCVVAAALVLYAYGVLALFAMASAWCTEQWGGLVAAAAHVQGLPGMFMPDQVGGFLWEALDTVIADLPQLGA